MKLTAEAVPFAEFDRLSYELEPGLFLSLEKHAGILPDEISYLPAGLHFVASEMQSVIER